MKTTRYRIVPAEGYGFFVERLIQATVERARADGSWRPGVAPSYPSGR